MTKKLNNTIPINKDVSRTICNKSNNYITLLTQHTKHTKRNHNTTNNTPYSKYKAYIKKTSTTFIKSQDKLLSKLFHIKDNTSFTITYTEELLSDSDSDSDSNSDSNSNSNNNNNSIPQFIDLFKYLITINDFITQFTLEEQNILNDKLSIEKSKKQCYEFLNKSPLGNKIITVYTSISNNNHFKNDTLFKTKFPSLEFHNLLINSFTSYKILEDLELNIKKLVKYSIEWKGKTFTNILYLFMYDKNKSTHNSTPEQLNKIGIEIIKRILFFNVFLNSETYPDKFMIFLTDNKKEIDKELIEEAHFKTINVNTAVTNSRDIIIYREQELFKSIFHELIHFHNLDFRHISEDILSKILNYLITTHNINENNEYLLYECITETLANILNNIYYSGSIKEFNTNLQDEIMFSTLQICKILHICKYKKWSEFSMSTNNKHIHSTHSKQSKQFKQDSCVFSYYILKLYILLNLDIYFKTILDSKMKFIKTEHSFNKLIEIFDASRKNSILETIINSILKGLKIDKTKKITKTLRMTCLESNIFINNAI